MEISGSNLSFSLRRRNYLATHSHALPVSAAAAVAKKEAKKIAGNSLFVERRQPAGAVPPALTLNVEAA